MSFAASDRASSTSQLSMRMSIRYASRKATAGDHAAWAVDGDGGVGLMALNALATGCVTVLGTHRRSGGRARQARRGCAGSPTWGSPAPSAAPDRERPG